jgi:hypothetical protein
MLEEPLLDARSRINCWTTAFSLALDKRKVGSDESHVVTQTAVNSVSSAEGPMCFPSRALILRRPPNPSMRVPRTSLVGVIPTFICGVFVLANDARMGATKGGSSLTATAFGPKLSVAVN